MGCLPRDNRTTARSNMLKSREKIAADCFAVTCQEFSLTFWFPEAQKKNVMSSHTIKVTRRRVHLGKQE